MSFHDIKETTRISPATTADQTTNPLMKEFLETAIAGVKSNSLRDQSALGDFRKDGTMLLGLAPLTDFTDAAKSEQIRQIGRGASDGSSSSGKSGGGTAYRNGDAPHIRSGDQALRSSDVIPNRTNEGSGRNGDAMPGRSTHKQIANTILAAKDALRSKSHESDASLVVMHGSLSAIAKSILSDLPRSSQSEGSVVSSIRAIIQETAHKSVAPPPRPK